jgi:fructan beta-fructosidase
MITESKSLYAEKHRPQLHFSAPKNWLNDPNGLVWHDGRYHLFYQYNPTGNTWGNMHWGHAVSKNLVEWEQRPLALFAAPESIGYMFSGCVVVDVHNTCGLAATGETPLVALYTNCTKDGVQAQSLAYSVDDGETWRQYDRNPVLPNPGIRDFRDPKVFWHTLTGKWVMVLAVKDHIALYTSGDLRAWELTSKFGRQSGSHVGVWECPDLFPMSTPSGQQRWILVISVCTEHSTRCQSVQYFVGEFDGTEFVPQQPGELWLDHGADCYGAITWEGIPAADGRRIMIGWMNSWKYAREAPTFPWSGHMTLPRELSLVEGSDGFELHSAPVREVEQLRSRTISVGPALVRDSRIQGMLATVAAELLDVQLQFSWSEAGCRPFGLRFSNGAGEIVTVSIDVAARLLTVNRTQAGQQPRHPKFTGCLAAPLRLTGNTLAIRVIKDCACIEVYAEQGQVVISANFFPGDSLDRVSLFADGPVEVRGEIAVLRSIWQGS